MRPEHYHAVALVELLRRTHIATIQELKAALGTAVDMTVFRKLREIAYHSSYSHRGKYYTLAELARFDERGLWSFRKVHFSRFGSLVETVAHFVAKSSMGLVASELAQELEVEVKQPLLDLVRTGRITRQEIAGRYVYCSADAKRRERQLGQRSELLPAIVDPTVPSPSSVEESKAAIVLFLSLLDERQRRLYAGLESLRWGRGGDRRVAELMGLDPHTVAKGRRDLMVGEVFTGRVRRAGGGRKLVEKKKRPESSSASKPS